MTLESKLIKAIKKKNKQRIEQVFEEIYNEYYNLVCFIIYRYIKSKEDIEELASDVFLNFYNRINAIEIKNIKYYLVSSAKNLSINFLRNKRLNTEIDIEAVNNYYDDNTNTNSPLIDDLEKELPKDDFYILYEHIVNGESLKAISEDLNMSYESVRKRYQRIVKKIRSNNKHEG